MASDAGRGPTHHSSSRAVAASHIQNRGRLAQILAQEQSSSSKKRKGQYSSSKKRSLGFFFPAEEDSPWANIYASLPLLFCMWDTSTAWLVSGVCPSPGFEPMNLGHWSGARRTLTTQPWVWAQLLNFFNIWMVLHCMDVIIYLTRALLIDTGLFPVISYHR